MFKAAVCLAILTQYHKTKFAFFHKGASENNQGPVVSTASSLI